MKLDAQQADYPATVLVHWPSGPVPACAEHAVCIVALGNFTGAHIAVTKLETPMECVNCRNEAEAALRNADTHKERT